MNKISTYYNNNTPQAVIDTLEKYMNTDTRIRIFYGYPKTGRDWLEDCHTMGYVSRSTGARRIPLLVPTKRSVGGTAILTECVVKITVDKSIVYQHPSYHLPPMASTRGNHGIALYVDNKIHARFESWEKLNKWFKFIQGYSNKK